MIITPEFVKKHFNNLARSTLQDISHEFGCCSLLQRHYLNEIPANCDAHFM